MESVFEPTNDPSWVLASQGYDPLRESTVESRFAISNGFLGQKAGRLATHGVHRVVSPRAYIAGLFDAPMADAVPELVSAADWVQLRILLSGRSMLHYRDDVLSHCATLDMKRGILLDEGDNFAAPDLKLHVRTLRLVSLGERALALQIIQFEVESGTVELTFEASFEGRSLGLASEHIEHELGVWRTHHSGKRLAIATASSLRVDGRNRPPTHLGQLKSSWTWTTHPGQRLCFERIAAIVRSDVETGYPGIEAREKLGCARQVGWRGVLEAHEAAWANRWQSSDVEVIGDPAAQLALRFAIYHMNGAANPADERVSIGAVALTGDDYRGHVLWHTEIFLLPFYALTWPEAARTLLMYRFQTLDAARAKAAEMGWRGALYAWESTDTGAETTPKQVIAHPDLRIVDTLCGEQGHHISADIAYAVWQYWQTTGDEAFLCEAGAEIILETSRFWTSRAELEEDGYYHIRGVVGPDEYHERVDDSAYTNVMARWNIRRGLDVAALLDKRWPACWARLSSRLDLDEAELKQWQNVADSMATGLDPQTGLFEQFSGYLALEDINLSDYAGRSVPMDMALGRERTQKSQEVKEADVVALLGLLPEEFPPGAAEVNLRYYERRCSHDRSLSLAMHGLVAARLGDVEMALHYFRQTAAIYLADTHVMIDRGVHMAGLGGIWMLVVFGFAGLSLRNDDLAIDPRLPSGWRGLTIRLQWRHRCLRIRLDQDEQFLEATLISGEPMALVVRGKLHRLCQEEALRVLNERP